MAYTITATSMYRNVRHRKRRGSLFLTEDGLVFHDDNDSNASVKSLKSAPIAWADLQDVMANIASSQTPILKFTLTSATSYKFAFGTRAILEQVRADVNTRWKQSHEDVSLRHLDDEDFSETKHTVDNDHSQSEDASFVMRGPPSSSPKRRPPDTISRRDNRSRASSVSCLPKGPPLPSVVSESNLSVASSIQSSNNGPSFSGTPLNDYQPHPYHATPNPHPYQQRSRSPESERPPSLLSSVGPRSQSYRSPRTEWEIQGGSSTRRSSLPSHASHRTQTTAWEDAKMGNSSSRSTRSNRQHRRPSQKTEWGDPEMGNSSRRSTTTSSSNRQQRRPSQQNSASQRKVGGTSKSGSSIRKDPNAKVTVLPHDQIMVPRNGNDGHYLLDFSTLQKNHQVVKVTPVAGDFEEGQSHWLPLDGTPKDPKGATTATTTIEQQGGDDVLHYGAGNHKVKVVDYKDHFYFAGYKISKGWCLGSLLFVACCLCLLVVVAVIMIVLAFTTDVFDTVFGGDGETIIVEVDSRRSYFEDDFYAGYFERLP